MRLLRIIWRFDGSRAAICSSGGGGKGGYEIRGRGGGGLVDWHQRNFYANSTVSMECVLWVCEIDDSSTLDSNVRYVLKQR